MEAILFLLDGTLIALMCFMAVKDDRRPRGAPTLSLFRFRDTLEAEPARRAFRPGTYREPGRGDPAGFDGPGANGSRRFR